MLLTYPVDLTCSDVDCAERVAGAIHDLSRVLKAGAADTATLHSPAQRLERHLVSGAFSDALALCRQLPPGQHAALFLAVIRQLESRWKTDSIGFADLAFAFYQLRHLIDGVASGPAVPAATMTSMAGSQDLRILVALAHGEKHSFGAQILAGELAAQGWAVAQDLSGQGERLGALVAQNRFDVLALSIGHDAALDGLADRIGDLRAQSCHARMSVMLGGGAFAEPRRQYAFLGADTVALSAAEASAWISSHHAARRLHRRN